MASIAYVSDQNMLDFHRINGSQEIVFWRLSTKKFSAFQPGDLLFFLSKGTENAKNNEKGIVGYGCYVGDKEMSIDHLWKKYNEMTGYSSKENLINAIQKTAKSDNLPETISCLFLKDVIFFQESVYLADLGINIPRNLESFTYLDAHEGHVTLELLQKVKEIGLDYWSASMSGKIVDMESFNREVLKYQVATVYESMNITTIQKNRVFQKHCYSLFKDKNPVWVNSDQNSFLIFGKENNELYYIYNSSQRDNRENFIKLLGQLVYIKNCLKQTVEEKINIKILSSIEFSDLQKESLIDNQLEFRVIDR